MVFLALGSSKEIHKTRSGHGNQIFKGPGYTGLLFQDRNNSEQSDEWDFLALATIHMFVQEKKVGARRHERLLLKKSLFVPATVVGLFRSSSWKSITPTAWPRSVSFWGVAALPASSVPDVNYPGYLPCGRASARRAQPISWLIPLVSLATFHSLGQACLMDTPRVL